MDRLELSSFLRAYTALGGRGSRVAVRFFLMSFMGHCDFENESQNQPFQSTLLVGKGGGHTKEYYVYALDNVDNSGRPLRIILFYYNLKVFVIINIISIVT